MNGDDIGALYSYIKKLHPNTPTAKIPLTRANAPSWIEALSGYTLEQAKGAADSHAAVCRYWPNLDEIKDHLPPVMESERRKHAPPTPSEMRGLDATRKWTDGWHRELAEIGLPALRQAIEQGMTLGEWIELLREGDAWGKEGVRP